MYKYLNMLYVFTLFLFLPKEKEFVFMQDFAFLLGFRR